MSSILLTPAGRQTLPGRYRRSADPYGRVLSRSDVRALRLTQVEYQPVLVTLAALDHLADPGGGDRRAAPGSVYSAAGLWRQTPAADGLLPATPAARSVVDFA